MPLQRLLPNLLHQKIHNVNSGRLELSTWQPVLVVPELCGDEIDAWCIPAFPSLTRNNLSAEELNRAARFRFAKDRDQFITGRCLLRQLLAAYQDIAPSAVNYVMGPRGKPALENNTRTPIFFNISHSAGLILFAFTRLGPIGVDIELIHDVPDFELVITRFFSKTEQQGFIGLDHEKKMQAFFTCWTRKEAFIKARGDGLSLPLDQFDVPILPGEKPALLRTAWDSSEISRWALTDIPVSDGYCAALAAALP